MHFITAGDRNYFFLVRHNCAQVRKHYPNSPIIIYDFGLDTDQAAELARAFQPIEVVDWQDHIDDFADIWANTSEDQKRKLALAPIIHNTLLI